MGGGGRGGEGLSGGGRGGEGFSRLAGSGGKLRGGRGGASGRGGGGLPYPDFEGLGGRGGRLLGSEVGWGGTGGRNSDTLLSWLRILGGLGGLAGYELGTVLLLPTREWTPFCWLEKGEVKLVGVGEDGTLVLSFCNPGEVSPGDDVSWS